VVAQKAHHQEGNRKGIPSATAGRKVTGLSISDSGAAEGKYANVDGNACIAARDDC